MVTTQKLVFISALAGLFLAFTVSDYSWAAARTYTIRIARTTDGQMARAKARELQAQGLEAVARKIKGQGAEENWGVYVGKYQSKKEAETAAQKLKASGLITAYQVRILSRDGVKGANPAGDQSNPGVKAVKVRTPSVAKPQAKPDKDISDYQKAEAEDYRPQPAPLVDRLSRTRPEAENRTPEAVKEKYLVVPFMEGGRDPGNFDREGAGLTERGRNGASAAGVRILSDF